jgi:hypothetical protein
MKSFNRFVAVAAVVAATFAFAQPTFAAEKHMAKHAAHSAPASQSFSRPYGMAGCGLGSMIVGKHGGQIFAATTNGTAWNQTFGIMAGTSNCVDNPNNAMASRMDQFVVANKVALAGDIARGNGETLGSLSTLLGCSDSIQLNSALQKNFSQIFPSYDVQPNIVTDSIISVVKTDQQLATSCKSVI